jgi:hypothetical protein
MNHKQLNGKQKWLQEFVVVFHIPKKISILLKLIYKNLHSSFLSVLLHVLKNMSNFDDESMDMVSIIYMVELKVSSKMYKK